MNYLERIRKSRISTIKACGHSFTVVRPTDLDVIDMRYDNLKDGILKCSKFVTDWDMTEKDLFSDGSDEKVRFSNDLFSEWIKDCPQYWEPIVTGLLKLHTEHRQKEEDLGNA